MVLFADKCVCDCDGCACDWDDWVLCAFDCQSAGPAQCSSAGQEEGAGQDGCCLQIAQRPFLFFRFLVRLLCTTTARVHAQYNQQNQPGTHGEGPCASMVLTILFFPQCVCVCMFEVKGRRKGTMQTNKHTHHQPHHCQEQKAGDTRKVLRVHDFLQHGM